MAFRVQRYGVTSTVMNTLVGLARELVVNTTRNSVHVHDGVTPGGFELGRADASNIIAASTESDGKMLISHVNQLNQATADTASLDSRVTSAETDITQLQTDVGSLTNNKMDKLVGAMANNIMLVDAQGQGIDSGFPFFATGTQLLFFSSLPTGWTLVTTSNDRAVIVSSTANDAGVHGGSWTISGISVNSTTLTAAQSGLPAHTHFAFTGEVSSHTTGTATLTSTDQVAATANNVTGDGDYAMKSSTLAADRGLTSSTGGTSASQGHTHGLTIDGTWRPLYVKAIRGQRA